MVCTACEVPKPGYRKGLWSPEEDQKLRNHMLRYGHGCWNLVPIRAGLQRNGKSCRLRWINYLRPGLKRDTFTKREEEIIKGLHDVLGNKWSQIAIHLPGRTDNEIKNYWNSHLSKRKMVKKNVNRPKPNRLPPNRSIPDPPPNPNKPGSPSWADSMPPSAKGVPAKTTFEPSEPLHHFTDIHNSNLPPFNQTVHALKGKPNFPKLLFSEWLDQLIPIDGRDASSSPSNSLHNHGGDMVASSDSSSLGHLQLGRPICHICNLQGQFGNGVSSITEDAPYLVCCEDDILCCPLCQFTNKGNL